MWFPSWQRNRSGSPVGERVLASRSSRRRASFRPRLDALEDRWVPSTLTVTNILDSGSGSLRAAIDKAHNRDTIVFAPSLDGQTIMLTSGELSIKNNITINGPGAGQLMISAGHTSGIFEVAAKDSLSLSGLTIAYGVAFEGGAIDNHGTLAVSSCTLDSNQASNDGGAIYNDYLARLTVTNTTLSGNSIAGGAGGEGGAISNHGSLTITGSTLSANSAQYGGAIYNTTGGTLTCNNSTLSDNSATDSGDGGAILCTGGSTATINGCTITNNSAYAGGGIYNYAASLTVSNTTFSGNWGGDIYGSYIDGGGNTLG
jgi:predicted outer membrane repeat protein